MFSHSTLEVSWPGGVGIDGDGSGHLRGELQPTMLFHEFPLLFLV